MSVTISLTFDTDWSKEHVLGEIAGIVRDHARLQPTSVNSYDSNDLDSDVVHLVASEDPTGATSTVVAFIGRAKANAAHAWAEEYGGVIVELPIDTDCRTEGAR